MNPSTDQGSRAVTAEALRALLVELFPICRSITGDGVRRTLDILRRYVPLEVHEVKSGTPVFDWVVPQEWNIRDAYIKNARGERVVDFNKCNLHVVSYSRPIKRTMPLAELRAHLHSLPDHPDWIPYRTTYYDDYWGFCLSHNDLTALPDAEYEVCIDSSLTDGYLTYGEFFIQGTSTDEVLISCHICHPSLGNDNLSGMALATHLAQELARSAPRYSYRFLFIPGTIGSITWLARNPQPISRIRHGLVVTCVGDGGRFTYKKSRRGTAEIDRAAAHVLRHSGRGYAINDFFPYGYDERQYCAPAFDLPVGCLMRSPHGSFPQYHTSADDLEFIRPEWIAESLDIYRGIVDVLERNSVYINLYPHGEPQLGKRGLYQAIGGDGGGFNKQLAMLWVLNLADGRNSLLDMAERSGLPFAQLQSVARMLTHHGLLREHERVG